MRAKAQQNPHLPRVAIFDLDGTVFDTEYDVSRITADLAALADCPATADYVFQNIAGLGSEGKFQAIAELSGRILDEETLKHLSAEHKRLKDGLYDAPDFRLVAGAKDLIESFYNQGIAIVAATNNHHEGAVKGLRRTGLLDYFEDRIYTPDSVGGLKKPDPAMFLQILDDLKIHPSQAIGVEDSLAGVEGLARAGIKAFAYVDPRSGPAIAARRDAFAAFGNCTPVEALRDIDVLLLAGLVKARLGKPRFTL